MAWVFSEYHRDVRFEEGTEVDNVEAFEHKETAALFGYHNLNKVVVYRDDIIAALNNLEKEHPTLFGSLRDLNRWKS